MERHVTQALQNYGKGYTCAQAVLCAYAQDMGLDMETAYKMIEGFGGGFGGMQEVCGALSAAFAVISYYSSDGKIEGGQTKLETYAKIREAAEYFKKEYGSVVCREVLGGAQPQPFKCGAKVKLAAEIAGNYCPKGIMGTSDFTR
ncbi:MAG: C-GCAxxG-C-C family protein [Lachnospiraceae bacterium]|nr:C-GCAxxG-C-C family protein [Lachnospiraceae bacterium]